MEKKLYNNSTKRFYLAGLILLATVTCVTSCKKSGADCFTSTGTVIKQVRIVSDFDTILARENVDIILTQDTVNNVVVEAGEKIIGGIKTVTDNRQLEIDNTNTCNWVRNYNKPLNVYVHVKNLRKIYYLSAGNITSTNVLTPKSFMLDVWGGCGSIDLSINVNQGFIYEHMGTADITIRGRAIYNSVVLGDFGFLQLKELNTDFTYVSNTGTNDCYINAVKYLDATIRSIGNIYYTGKPDTVHAHITGAGQLIEF
jgi:Putative auto-transporter adhesin, head GIN domain